MNPSESSYRAPGAGPRGPFQACFNLSSPAPRHRGSRGPLQHQHLPQVVAYPLQLVITRVLSQPLADYKVDTPTAMAARQLEAAGIHIQPGEKVRYVHREGKKGPKECRVAAAPFLETLDGYDIKLYLELLERAVEELMLAFGKEM